VPESFPNIDILLSYTNPVISATDASSSHTHMPPQWDHEPDIGKLAHLCGLHFEWGLKDIILKHFRSIIWPGIVLRALRHSALREEDGDGHLQELIVKIHSSQTHAYTDGILEYCLEVAPAQLVHLASTGIQGLRKPADTTYDVLPSESEDKSHVGPHAEPDSHLHVWMPACMVCSALPELVEQYEAELDAKHTKKRKGKQPVPHAKEAKFSSSSKKRVMSPLQQPMNSDPEEFDGPEIVSAKMSVLTYT
jgi:holliday junction resolvase YEN1